jgi:Tol biopolymer transport system component
MGTREDTIRGLIPEDLLKFSWLEEIATAPGGERVAYTVRRPDAGRNGYQTDLYLLDLETRETEKLSEGEGQGSGLAWSRDGERLAFVWKGERTRVEVRKADGEKETAYEIEGGVPLELDWSPDGERIAFARWTKVEAEDERGVRAGVPEPTIRVVRRLRYKQNGVGWVEDTYKQIWVLELGSGDRVQVTDGECDYGEPRWSWDGRRLAFTAVGREQNTNLGQGQVMVCEYES